MREKTMDSIQKLQPWDILIHIFCWLYANGNYNHLVHVGPHFMVLFYATDGNPTDPILLIPFFQAKRIFFF